VRRSGFVFRSPAAFGGARFSRGGVGGGRLGGSCPPRRDQPRGGVDEGGLAQGQGATADHGGPKPNGGVKAHQDHRRQQAKAFRPAGAALSASLMRIRRRVRWNPFGVTSKATPPSPRQENIEDRHSGARRVNIPKALGVEQVRIGQDK